MSAIFGSPPQQQFGQQMQQPGIFGQVFGQGQRTCGKYLNGMPNGMQNEQPMIDPTTGQPSCVKPWFGGKHKRRKQRGGFDPYDPAAQPQALVGGRRRKSKSTRRKTGGKRKGTKSRRSKKTRTHKRR